MAKTSKSLKHVTLSGNIYLAIEEPGAPANGDLRISQDPNHKPGYIKLEVFSTGQWHLLESSLCFEEFSWCKPSCPDSSALACKLAKMFQHLLQALHQHLYIEWDIGKNFLCISEVSYDAHCRHKVDEARFEALQLFVAHEPEL
jgi:hypothetical protein